MLCRAVQAACELSVGVDEADGPDPDPYVPVRLTSEEDYEACLEHALGLMDKELDDVGEAVLEVRRTTHQQCFSGGDTAPLF